MSEPANIQVYKGQSRIEHDFIAFHNENPEVLRKLWHLAWKAKESGQKKIGMKMLFEVLRWEEIIDVRSHSDYKLNNNYTAYYARLLMHHWPEQFAGMFDVRKQARDFDPSNIEV